MARFLDAIRSGRVLLMDGAMYTELHRAGLPEDECAELWNLTFPEKVREVHRSYVDAGAEVLLTNTFQANPAALAKHGLQQEVGAINRAAVSIARQAAGPHRFVLASIGPVAEPTHDGARSLVSSLEGADGLLLETQTDVQFLEMVLEANQERRGHLPILFSFTFLREPEGGLVTRNGLGPKECAVLIDRFPVTALGVNCGRDIGMEETIEIVRGYRHVTTLPLLARPNAGTPNVEGATWSFPQTAAAMARKFPALIEAGACLVGGCCGTTAEYIARWRPFV
jgi:5-methyltetrahydrofolate--homocysteine methyltransferase